MFETVKIYLHVLVCSTSSAYPPPIIFTTNNNFYAPHNQEIIICKKKPCVFHRKILPEIPCKSRLLTSWYCNLKKVVVFTQKIISAILPKQNICVMQRKFVNLKRFLGPGILIEAFLIQSTHPIQYGVRLSPIFQIETQYTKSIYLEKT